MSNKIQPSYDTKRCRLGEAVPLDTPFRITFDSSEVCNLKCNYCFRSGKPADSWGYAGHNDLMQWETFQTAASQLLEFPSKPKVVALSGSGEPLCNRNVPQMAAALKEMDAAEKLEMHTNAVLLTKDNVKAIAACGIDKIVISLQGISAQAYEKTCSVRIDFEQFYSNLELLYQNKAPNTLIHIKVVDTALAGVEEDRFYQMFSPIADQVNVEHVVALWQDQLDYEEDANTTSNKYGVNFGHIECCPILFTNLTVSPDGTIWPCCVIRPPFALGNVREISLRKAWESETRRQFLRANVQKGHLCHPYCEKCYFPKGYVKTDLDILDPYRDEILKKLGPM